MFETYEITGKTKEVIVLQPNVDPYTEKYDTTNFDTTKGLLSQTDSLITPKTEFIIAPETVLAESIPFDHVDQWIIVYDESVTPNAHLFDDARIQEYGCQGHSIAGNIQRNYALDLIGDTYVYFLDDDTIMHPDMSEFLKTVEPNHIYTFDQQRNAKEFPFTDTLKGDTIEMFRIDTAMFLIDSSLIQDIRWSVDEYTADAIFITECYSTHPESWIYVDRVLSYYNYLNDFKRKG